MPLESKSGLAECVSQSCKWRTMLGTKRYTCHFSRGCGCVPSGHPRNMNPPTDCLRAPNG
jgi:hypothetical protein